MRSLPKVALIIALSWGSSALCIEPESEPVKRCAQSFQSDGDPSASLALIQSKLRRDAGRAKLWSLGWGLGYTALGTANLVLGATSKAETGVRMTYFLPGAASFLTPLTILFMPLRVMGDSAFLDSREDGGDLCAALGEAEERFRLSADNEADKAGIIAHAGALVVNSAVLLVLGLGYGQWRAGVINAVVGLLLAEITIWTQPTALVGDYRRYRAGELGEGPPRLSWALFPTVGEGAPGLNLLVSF
jgi:hypothetical protein